MSTLTLARRATCAAGTRSCAKHRFRPGDERGEANKLLEPDSLALRIPNGEPVNDVLTPAPKLALCETDLRTLMSPHLAPTALIVTLEAFPRLPRYSPPAAPFHAPADKVLIHALCLRMARTL